MWIAVKDLPDNDGDDSIVVVIDSLSKPWHLIATHETLSAVAIVQLLSLTGFQIHFNLLVDIFGRYGTKLRMRSVYSPRTDGSVERLNMVLEKMSHSYVNHHQHDWYMCACSAEFANNNVELYVKG